MAFLSLSVPIKSQLHYEKCLKARIAQLREVFRAKLGWLAGDIYSRVATPDWAPKNLSDKDFNSIIETLIEEQAWWVDDKLLTKLKLERNQRRKTSGAKYQIPPEDVDKLLDSYLTEEESKRRRHAKFIIEQVHKLISDVKKEKLQELELSLINNQDLDEFF